MTRHRAIAICDDGIVYRDFQEDVASAEAFSYSMYANDYSTAGTVGDINGSEYIVIYHKSKEKSDRNQEIEE